MFQDDDVNHEAQRAELVFLPLSITLEEFTPLAMKDRPRQFVPVLAAIQLRERPTPFGFIVNVGEAVKVLVDASELGDRLDQFRWAIPPRRRCRAAQYAHLRSGHWE